MQKELTLKITAIVLVMLFTLTSFFLTISIYEQNKKNTAKGGEFNSWIKYTDSNPNQENQDDNKNKKDDWDDSGGGGGGDGGGDDDGGDDPTNEVCDDGNDNDQDGKTDCADSECYWDPYCTANRESLLINFLPHNPVNYPFNPGSTPKYTQASLEAGSGTYTITINFDAPAKAATYINYTLAGDALLGTYYNIVSGTSPIQVLPGDPSKSIVLDILSNPKYHLERLLQINLTEDTSTFNISTNTSTDEFRIYIRPSAQPPELIFNKSSETGVPGNTYTFDIGFQYEDLTEEHSKVYYKQTNIGGANAAVEGVDFDWKSGQGLNLFSNRQWVFPKVEILPTATDGRVLKIEIDHENRSGNEENEYTNTHVFVLEEVPPTWPGEPGDYVSFGGQDTSNNSLPLIIFQDTVKKDPIDGAPLFGVQMDPVTVKGFFTYLRKSFESQLHSDGARNLHELKRYNFFSIRVDNATGYTPSDFYTMTIRDRGYKLNDSSFTGDDPNHITYFQRDPVTGDWSVNSFQNMYNGTRDSDAGVIKDKYGTRLWMMYEETNSSLFGDSMAILVRPVTALTGGPGSVAGQASLIYWPFLKTSDNPISLSPIPEDFEKKGNWWTPRGKAVTNPSSIYNLTIDTGATGEICDDDMDNDGDGRIDCGDSNCDGQQGNGGTCEFQNEETCDDLFDNDNDSFMDCADSDCSYACATYDFSGIKWQKVEMSFSDDGAHDETDLSPINPFRDYVLDANITSPTGVSYIVPGFFDGDGAGDGNGNVWKVRFSPSEEGVWTFNLSFKYLGSPESPIDGITGTITVGPINTSAPGFLKYGLLEYVGSYYLKFREGPYWIKTGADSPENFFGYAGFDDTYHPGSGLGSIHFYTNHISDFNAGDPLFVSQEGPHTGTDSKGIIGALNYLNGIGVNSIYFLPMNIGGDAKDTWPYLNAGINPVGSQSNNNFNFDISRLNQWETVFSHAENKSIQLYMILCEAEIPNKNELDSATLGEERKLFYRELVARFGHHLGISWNLCEEYNLNLDIGPAIGDWAAYLKSIDPYDHPITVHVASSSEDTYNHYLADGIFGNESFDMASIQDAGGTCDYLSNGDGSAVEIFREESFNQGRPFVVNCDEIRSISSFSSEQQRKEVTYPVLLSGGQIEWYSSSQDQSLDDFRTYETLYTETKLAREFLEDNFPFEQMRHNDSLINNIADAQVFARTNIGIEAFAIYLPSGGNPNLWLPNTGDYRVQWYNVRTGTYSPSSIVTSTGGWKSLGTPVYTNDVAVLVERN